MKIIKIALGVLFMGFVATSCVSNSGANNGQETPIDSTNVNGTAPVTYGGNNPANDADTNKSNYRDTGTKANTIHYPNNDSTNAAQQR